MLTEVALYRGEQRRYQPAPPFRRHKPRSLQFWHLHRVIGAGLPDYLKGFVIADRDRGVREIPLIFCNRSGPV